jgi:hypothetical protein
MASPHGRRGGVDRSAYMATPGGQKFGPDQLDEWLASRHHRRSRQQRLARHGLINAKKAVDTARSPVGICTAVIPDSVSFGTDRSGRRSPCATAVPGR